MDLTVERSYIWKTLAMGLGLVAVGLLPLLLLELDWSQKLLAGFMIALGGVIGYNCWKFYQDPLRHRVDEAGIWIYKNLRYRSKFIPWEDVADFEPHNSVLHYGPIPYRREQMIHIHLRPASRHFRSGRGERPLALDFMGVRQGRGEVMEAMRAYHRAKAPSEPKPAQEVGESVDRG